MDNLPIERRYVSLKDAAIYLGLSPKTLYEWVTYKKLPAYKLGRVWRFDRRELDTFIHSRYNPNPSGSVVGIGQKVGKV